MRMYMGSEGIWVTPEGHRYRLGEYETKHERTRTWRYLTVLGMGPDEEQHYLTRNEAIEHATTRGWKKI